MVRGNVPIGQIKSLIRQRATTYTIYRPKNNTSGWGEQATNAKSDFETDANGNYPTGDIDVQNVSMAPTQLPTGQSTSANADGFCLAGANVEVGDMIQYGSHVLEVEVLDPVQDGDTTELYRIQFTDRSDVTLP